MTKNPRYLILACLIFSLGILFLACLAMWKNAEFAGGNHSFLFGSKTEGFLMHYALLIPLLGSIPLIIPALLKKRTIFWMIAAASIPLFIFLKYVILVLTD